MRVGEPLGREGQIAVELAELDPHAREPPRDLGALALGGGAGPGDLLAPVLGVAHPGSRRREAARVSSAKRASMPATSSVSRSSSLPGEGDLHGEPLLGELGVALGLAALAGEAPDLGLDLGDEVLHPLKVHRRLFQSPLGAVLPVAVEPDPRRLLEERPALVGAVGEEEVDHLRLDHHAGVAAEPGAAQQVLDVAEPDRRAVEQVVALARAREPPGDDHLAVRDREVAVAVVEEEGDLGDVDRPAGRRALEDHVLHLPAAEQPGRLLAQHPAHRVGDVGLAAAVGAHDGGHAFLEGERDACRRRT